jgi:hypothetical protein
MEKKISPRQAGAMFDLLMKKLGKDDVNEILFNWNESELNDDATEIRMFVDSRGRGPGTGGASRVKKAEFIEWLLSQAPLDTKIYGEHILQDKHWTELVDRARKSVREER